MSCPSAARLLISLSIKVVEGMIPEYIAILSVPQETKLYFGSKSIKIVVISSHLGSR